MTAVAHVSILVSDTSRIKSNAKCCRLRRRCYPYYIIFLGSDDGDDVQMDLWNYAGYNVPPKQLRVPCATRPPSAPRPCHARPTRLNAHPNFLGLFSLSFISQSGSFLRCIYTRYNAPSYSTLDVFTRSHEQGEEIRATFLFCERYEYKGFVRTACQSTRTMYRAFWKPLG